MPSWGENLTFGYSVLLNEGWPVFIPFLFVAGWYLFYGITRRALPAGAMKATIIWFFITILVLPALLGYVLVIAIAIGHGSGSVGTEAFLLIILLAGVVFFYGIIPFLMLKSIKDKRYANS